MARHEFGYFVREGVSNMFGHGFMSFAAIGVTIGCLLIMGTFSLVAYNAEEQLRVLEEENQIVAFVDDSLSRTQGEALAARGVAVRAGFHCAPLAHRTAGTLESGTVRVSPSAFTSPEQIDRFCSLLQGIIRESARF